MQVVPVKWVPQQLGTNFSKDKTTPPPHPAYIKMNINKLVESKWASISAD